MRSFMFRINHSICNSFSNTAHFLARLWEFTLRYSSASCLSFLFRLLFCCSCISLLITAQEVINIFFKDAIVFSRSCDFLNIYIIVTSVLTYRWHSNNAIIQICRCFLLFLFIAFFLFFFFLVFFWFVIRASFFFRGRVTFTTLVTFYIKR